MEKKTDERKEYSCHWSSFSIRKSETKTQVEESALFQIKGITVERQQVRMTKQYQLRWECRLFVGNKSIWKHFADDFVDWFGSITCYHDVVNAEYQRQRSLEVTHLAIRMNNTVRFTNFSIMKCIKRVRSDTIHWIFLRNLSHKPWTRAKQNRISNLIKWVMTLLKQHDFSMCPSIFEEQLRLANVSQWKTGSRSFQSG